MIDLAHKINTRIEPLRVIADLMAAPFWDLFARMYVGLAFFKAGSTRLQDWLHGNFGNQIFLFDLEHPVPFLHPILAAYITMLAELIFSVLLMMGLFSRFSAAGFLIMTAVIHFTYQENVEHVLWGFLAASIFIKGPGVFSVDHWLVKYLRSDRTA